jgi:ubiquinol-cytochrome c reductase iron-sulfur subunit
VNDPSKRAFSYFVLGGSRFLYATAARLVLVKFVGSMSASADVLALASAEFDLSAIDVGSTVTVKWRGKPVFIRHRTQSEIDDANSVSLGELRDPETDADRTQDPNWCVRN